MSQPVRPLRICMVTGEYPPDEGGVADYTACLVAALAAEGLNVDVLTTRRRIPGLATAEADAALGADPHRMSEGADGPPHRMSERADGPPHRMSERADGPPHRMSKGADGPTQHQVSDATDGPDPHRISDAADGSSPGRASEVANGASPGRVAVYRSVRHWHRGALRGLGRLIELTGPDLVHMQYQAAAYGMHLSIHGMNWWVGRHYPVLRAVTYHDLRVPYLFPKAGPMRPWALRQLARHAELAITTNAADHDQLAGDLPAFIPRPDDDAGASSRNSGPMQALVPIGSNIEDDPPPGFERSTFRRNAGYAPDSLLLAYFGFLNESKGGRTLLDALGQLRAAGHDARLVMIGGTLGASDPTNSAYLAGFEAELAARGLTDAVRWTGHLAPSGVSAWLHAADAVTLPYRDGASYRRGSLLAALAHSRPVVSTLPAPAGEGGLPALVDGSAALLVPPDDSAALVAAVLRIANEPELAARLGEGGGALAGHFTWQRIARQHVELYRELLGRG